MSTDGTLFERLETRQVWGDKEWNLAEAAAHELFNPTSAIDQERLFSGRLEQATDLLGVIYERGAHAILFGERGVGKSSLANILEEKIGPKIANLKFYKDNCRPEDTFFSLWSKMLWDCRFDERDVSEYLKDETRPFVVVKILESLPKNQRYIFIFDEFDRIESLETKKAMADTIKHFSDYPQNITIIMVGVGFSIKELFGAHPSIQRCCQQIEMPRMTQDELRDIVVERYTQIGIKASTDIIDFIVNLAQGLPGFAHLIGREAALSAIRRKSREVEIIDCTEAVKEAVRRAQEHIVSAYNQAIYSPKKNMYKQVLLACALANRDDRGKFSATAVREKLAEILDKPVKISYFARHLATFCSAGHGPVLRKTGQTRGFQYQFIEAPLQPYIIMVGRKEGII